nr:cell cycle checkpoint protein RAD17-like isoform X6 [Parasteatoda tepidariorum]XP_042911439.1 cell cycle checkpoint protein RAD17-like isoform X6 [Parasteatoda tepidariorum]XP_042911440.1 cell cycle checkpoint protein RAD17-like isoform X6 [Parasteatoda tepidariorum]XP_042911441.1 cell cycle checkpoint protein RAD17-like isoform X6 [Parasteatoda tepidariorum]
MMMKVLTKINNSPKVHSCYKKISKSEIENIVADSLGDAINSMQFMCMSCDASNKSNQDVLPTHLKMFERDPLISNPEEVFDKTSISAEAFTLFLQENYIPFVDDIEANFECAHWLSEADYVSALWNSRDTMNDYMVSLASRSLMFNLSSVNNRRWRALHKPQFYVNLSEQRQLQKSLKYAFSAKWERR